MQVEIGGRKGWSKETGCPGPSVTALRDRFGVEAFVVGMQAGTVDRRDPDSWIVSDSGYLWAVFASPDEFVEWSRSAPRVEGRRNFFEPVSRVTRLMFRVKKQQPGAKLTKDGLFRVISSKLLPWLDRLFTSRGFKGTGAGELCNWRFTDASEDSGTHAFGAYSQTVKWTESARQMLVEVMNHDAEFMSMQATCAVNFQAYACTGAIVVVPACIDARTGEGVTNDPIQPESARRMAAGPCTFADFLSTNGFTERAAALDLDFLTHFSLDPRFVPGEPIDIEVAAAPLPQWLVDAEAEYNMLGYGPVDASQHMEGSIISAEERQTATLKAPNTKCPSGITHDTPKALQFCMEADGRVSVTCCGPDRGSKDDLHVLDSKNKRKPGLMVGRSATVETCGRLSLAMARLDRDSGDRGSSLSLWPLRPHPPAQSR